MKTIGMVKSPQDRSRSPSRAPVDGDDPPFGRPGPWREPGGSTEGMSAVVDGSLRDVAPRRDVAIENGHVPPTPQPQGQVRRNRRGPASARFGLWKTLWEPFCTARKLDA